MRSLRTIRQTSRSLGKTSTLCYKAIGTSALSRSFSTKSDDNTTHFGFRTIEKESKEPMVAEIFHAVADKYDVMNDAMSAGMHRLWKDELIEMINPMPHATGRPFRALDVAGGTGDVAFRIAKRLQAAGINGAKYQQNAPKAGEPEIVVCDINPSMLRVGKARAEKFGLNSIDQPGNGMRPLFDWVEGNAEKLQFADNSFDLYTIAFGIRNVTNIENAISEAYRVLRPGGRFLVLEFSHLPNPVLQSLYDAYSFNIIPELGQAIANDRSSYQYLVESIRRFPKQDDFKALIEQAGFQSVEYTNMTCGVVAIHSGFKF